MDASATNLASNYLPIGIQLIFAAGFIRTKPEKEDFLKICKDPKVQVYLREAKLKRVLK